MAGPSTGVGGRGTVSDSVGAGGWVEDGTRVGVRITIDVGTANLAVASLAIVGVAVGRGAVIIALFWDGLAGSEVGLVNSRSQAANIATTK
jgi:hypothetical protein